MNGAQRAQRFYQRHKTRIRAKRNRRYHEDPKVRQNMRECHQRHYLSHREEILLCNKQRRLNNPQGRRERQRRNREEWGITDRNDKETQRESEFFVASHIIPKLGFTNILVAYSLWGRQFPFDIIAEKDGVQVGIEVGLTYGKKIKPTQIEFMRRFNIRGFICHLKPDYSWFCLKEITGTYSTCWGIYVVSLSPKFSEYAYRRATDGLVTCSSLEERKN